ncbi:MAG: DUF1501 domain-containing protein [Pirellulaceae bacterium]|jgi:uncharacterized protein (DUF1501 family)|nr:DUF1501 domain-containing protein [Pirellulaceae bacterium]
MFPILGNHVPLCDRLTRREWLRIGGVGLGGLALPHLLEQQAAGNTRRPSTAKNVIVVFITGGFPQHESWDPKPDAPAEIRGAFGTIPTRTPGYFVGELMPKTAELTDKIAVIRSVVTGDNAHSTSGYQMLTGVPHAPLNRENAAPGRPNDWPAVGGIVQALVPSQGGLPASVALPRRIANNNGQDPWPGTDAGFLGRKHDPWLLECNPADENFAAPGCSLSADVPPLRLDQRRSLLDQFRAHAELLDRTASAANLDHYRQQAVDLIAGGQAQAAFDLTREPNAMRDRYGRTIFGQSVLLARRLVEAGVSLVQVQWASTEKNRPNGGGWDTHEKHSESLKGWLMPEFDQVYSALLTDLIDRGMLDETLVCLVTEFGHTPKFNAKAGRDHWGRVFSIALAGGGIRGGVVHGSSDRHAAEPMSDIVRPSDYLATVFHCLGFEPDTIVHDVQGRPFPISRGTVIESILR